MGNAYKRMDAHSDLVVGINQLIDRDLGNANYGMCVRNTQFNGSEPDAHGGAATTGLYSHIIRSTASGGKHQAWLLSATSATATPSTANAVGLMEDAGLSIGAGKYLRLYDAAGTDKVELSSDADGGLVLGGSGTNAGKLALTSLAATSFVAIGTNPSTTGPLRLANTGEIKWRNPGNTADVGAIVYWSDSNLYLGAATADNPNVIVRAPTAVFLQIAGNNEIQVNATGTIVGRAAAQVGFFGSAGAAKPSAYTQTYSTTTKTHANPSAVTLTSGAGTPAGGTTDVGAAFSQSTLNNNFATLVTAINALVADLANVKQVLNAVIDDAQALNLVG